MKQPTASETRELLSAMRGRRIAVVGDIMLDCYLHGPLERISPEAPVPVFEIGREEYKLGGAANVAACLAALGADVKLAGIIGNDEHGERLVQDASRLDIDADAALVDPQRPTTCKTRVVARNQQILRLDRESRRPLSEMIEREFMQRLRCAVEWADAVILSDYAKGVLTSAVCAATIRAANGRPVVVDPKKLPWHRYRGATVLKPNRVEAEQFAQTSVDADSIAADVALQIAVSLDVVHVVLTRGAGGMTLASRPGCAGATVHHLAAHHHELVDVTGAGDVVAAALTMALAAGTTIFAATRLANVAAGIKVGKFGAAAVSPAEILAAVGDGPPSFAQKVLSLADATSLVRSVQAQGKRVVFTNGCFDLLHLGHVTYLERSKKLGDLLVVGLNTDASVRRLKGKARPIQKEADRAQIIASQASVDAVILFDEDTPLELIRGLRPNVITKGADYGRKEAVVGWDLLESWGGRVVLIDMVEGRSTTKLVKQAA